MRDRRRLDLTRATGIAAVAFSALYFLSDLIEAAQGGFSDAQLWLTLIAEAAIPFFVVGLCLAQRPRIGRLGEISAIAYAYAFVFFTGTVVYALLEGTPDYDALSDDLGALMTAHGAIMVIAGLGFGYAVIRAGALPSWTGVALGLGVVLVAATQGMAEGSQLVAAAVRDLAFAGMGAALLRGSVGGTVTGHGTREAPPQIPTS
ncbi:MAG: hypothetical protein ACOYD4_04490 [Solirubrobacterales bacterium]